MTTQGGTHLETMWSSLLTELSAHRPRPETVAGQALDEDGAQAIPVTLVSGFLGAGKSTLLVRLLSAPPEGLVIRAVVNDIGSLPFDPTLVTADGPTGATAEVEVSLTNGCGCCEQSADLMATLDRVARGQPDLIVLEASGVADPLALAQVVEAHPGLHLDRIVTVVDGAGVEAQSHHPAVAPILGRQLEAAHCVVLSHADRLPEEDDATVTALLTEMAPGRVIVPSTLTQPATATLTPSGPRGAGLTTGGGSRAAGHDLVTTTVTQERTLSSAQLEAALANRPPELLRGKGLLMVDDVPQHVQFNTTAATVSPAPTAAVPSVGRFTLTGTTASAVQTWVRHLVRGAQPQAGQVQSPQTQEDSPQ